MRRKRYPSGDLKRVISVFGRLWLQGEVTDAQAAAGFVIADIYRSSDFGEASKDRRGVTTAATGVGPNASQRDRNELDDFLSKYPSKVRNALIELCVLDRTVDWVLRPQIRQVLDDVAAQLVAPARGSGLKVGRRSAPTSARLRQCPGEAAFRHQGGPS
jgi:hypothetical protein